MVVGGTVVVVTMTCCIGPLHIARHTPRTVLNIGYPIGTWETKDGCMIRLGMPRKPWEKRHSKFCMKLGYEEPHVCGLRATISVVPCSPPTFQPHGPMPHCPPLQF
jgi:hypothetical protein